MIDPDASSPDALPTISPASAGSGPRTGPSSCVRITDGRGAAATSGRHADRVEAEVALGDDTCPLPVVLGAAARRRSRRAFLDGQRRRGRSASSRPTRARLSSTTRCSTPSSALAPALARWCPASTRPSGCGRWAPSSRTPLWSTTTPVILKVFRRLADGPNPDVEVTEALAGSGSRGGRAARHLAPGRTDLALPSGSWPAVPRAGRWPSPRCATSTPSRPIRAEAGGDFGAEAHRLGEITAELHVAWPRPSRTAGQRRRLGRHDGAHS